MTKRALIATLYNEAGNLHRWWDCIRKQEVQPDEIVIVDGGSKDGTWQMLQDLARESPVPVRLKQQRCNIAEGRNLAIQLTEADVIAANDAGSFPQPAWFKEITQPLMADPELDVVGGRSVNLVENDFQKIIADLQGAPTEPKGPEEVYPSSRNIAFRRQVWARIGGYPEWLTLTGEDALFNHNLHKIGCRFYYGREAVVVWMARNDATAYFKMLRSYGYGAAEAGLFGKTFLVSTVISLCPLLLLLSKRRTNLFWLRYRKYLSSSLGWFAGWLWGHRPPKGWSRVGGVWLSPEAQQWMASASGR